MAEGHGLWFLLNLHMKAELRSLWKAVKHYKQTWGDGDIEKYQLLPDIRNYLGRRMDDLYENVTPNN